MICLWKLGTVSGGIEKLDSKDIMIMAKHFLQRFALPKICEMKSCNDTLFLCSNFFLCCFCCYDLYFLLAKIQTQRKQESRFILEKNSLAVTTLSMQVYICVTVFSGKCVCILLYNLNMCSTKFVVHGISLLLRQMYYKIAKKLAQNRIHE